MTVEALLERFNQQREHFLEVAEELGIPITFHRKSITANQPLWWDERAENWLARYTGIMEQLWPDDFNALMKEAEAVIFAARLHEIAVRGGLPAAMLWKLARCGQ